MKQVIIIGNGIAGVTAARNIRKRSQDKILLISAETKYFFSRTALMYAYMGIMPKQGLKPYEDSFWEQNNIDLLQDQVLSIDFESKTLQTKTSRISYDQLVLATGSSYRHHPLVNDAIHGVTGMYSWQDLEYIEEHTNSVQSATIIGGGLIGIELAEMLHSRGIETHVIIREEEYWGNVLPREEAVMVGKHIIDHGIHLHRSENLQEVLTEENRITGIVTDKNRSIDCHFLGITIGVEPNINFIKHSGLEINRGILVDDHLRTSIPDVYAIGDCAELRKPDALRRAIEPVWYTARKMGEVVALNICGKQEKYTQGIWFNSAKFLDLEFQTYGHVPKDPESQGLDSFLWQDTSGDRLIRIVYHSENKKVAGINLLGVRWRHEVCESWIKQEWTVKDVLQDVDKAHFDQEFKPYYQQELIEAYNKKHNDSIPLSGKKRGFLTKLFAR